MKIPSRNNGCNSEWNFLISCKLLQNLLTIYEPELWCINKCWTWAENIHICSSSAAQYHPCPSSFLPLRYLFLCHEHLFPVGTLLLDCIQLHIHLASLHCLSWTMLWCPEQSYLHVILVLWPAQKLYWTDLHKVSIF